MSEHSGLTQSRSSFAIALRPPACMCGPLMLTDRVYCVSCSPRFQGVMNNKGCSCGAGYRTDSITGCGTDAGSGPRFVPSGIRAAHRFVAGSCRSPVT